MTDLMNYDLVIGTIDTGYKTRAVVTVHVEYTRPGEERHGQLRPDGCLTFEAQAKRPRATDIDAGGQMQSTLREAMSLGEIEYATGWGPYKLRRLLSTWDRWHLNDMQAGCKHQRALGWTSYDEHPSEPCPVCGYRYGSAWRTERVPEYVLNYLLDLNGGTHA